MLEHVVEAQKALAEDHPSRLALQHSLAIVYQIDEQVEKTIPILEHVVEVEAALGEGHPWWLTSQIALLESYEAAGH